MRLPSPAPLRATLAALLAAASLAGCADDLARADEDLAAEDATVGDGKADASWAVAPTLHAGERTYGRVDAGARQVFPVWVAGRPGAPVTLDVEVAAVGPYTVRVAVLGPLVNGARQVVAAGGYASATAAVQLAATTERAGEHLIVIGAHGLATETQFDVIARCAGCAPGDVDVLAAPKAGALVATAGGALVQAELGDVLAGRGFDVELEVWASPPMRAWEATRVASGVASGTQANVIVPAAVAAGDDLTLVVRESGGRVLDTGVLTRYAPTNEALVRTDALLLGDIVSVQAAGIAPYTEGRATLVLRSEVHGRAIAERHLTADRPGQPGNGLGAFDAMFAPDIELPDGTINPNLPRNGELLSIGWLDGDAAFRRLGCFEYCNDLSGEDTCTGGTRACPTTATAP